MAVNKHDISFRRDYWEISVYPGPRVYVKPRQDMIEMIVKRYATKAGEVDWAKAEDLIKKSLNEEI
jgi:hypothetical protein